MARIATRVQDGNYITVTLDRSISAGTPVPAGGGYGILCTDAVPGEPVTVAVAGVYEMPVADADIISGYGITLYYDEANQVVTTDDDDGNRCKIGHPTTLKLSTGPGSVGVRLDISGVYEAPAAT